MSIVLVVGDKSKTFSIAAGTGEARRLLLSGIISFCRN
jgi:hypothetical protein